MRAIALLLFGVLLGLAAREEKRSTPLRKARETHKLAIERPKTIRK